MLNVNLDVDATFFGKVSIEYMIYLRLAGGLGNQLFQFAAAMKISRESGLPIALWTAGLQNYKTPRSFVLDKFVNLEKSNIRVENNNKVLKFRLPRFFPFGMHNILFISDHNIMIPDNLGKYKHIYMDGYFIESINQNFFDEELDIINPLLILKKNKEKNTCAIHVRGNDFISLGLSIRNIKDYYSKSVEKVANENENISFKIITDDREFSHSLLYDVVPDIKFGTYDICSDFSSIIFSDYAILSNSTFSFWAGALRSQKNKRWSTIMPPEWRPGIKRNIFLRSEIYLSNGKYKY